MALKDKWIDKIDGVDDVLSEHINDVAHGVIELEENQKFEAEPNSTAVRGSSGQLKVAAPIENGDSVNLKFFKEKASNAFVGEKIGNQIEINDLAFSPNFCSISVESKNLVPLVYKTANRGTSVTISGVTFTVNSDGSVTLNGKNNGKDNSSFFLVNSTSQPLVLKKGTYIGGVGIKGLYLSGLVHETGKYVYFSTPYTAEKDIALRFLYFGVSKGATTEFNGETVYPMLMRGTVCEDYVEPIEDGTDVLITSGIREINSKVGEDLSVQNVENGSVFQAQNPRVSLMAKYNRDINSVYEELKNAIISMGANV